MFNSILSKMSSSSSNVAPQEWRPLRVVAENEFKAKQLLIVWDFDCSLAAEHMWSALRSDDGQAMLRSQPDEFYSLVFGGPARLGRLRACLAALSEAGATMLILSNGIEEEIEAALAHIGVRNRFAAVLGGESQVAFGTDALGKPALIAKLALERMANKADAGQLPLTHIILIDDDPDNYPTAEAGSSKRVLTAMGSSSGAPPAERQSWVMTVRGKQMDDAPLLVAWPVVPAAGVSAASMARLEKLIGANVGSSAPPSPPGEEAVDVTDEGVAPPIQLAPSLASLPPPPVIPPSAYKYVDNATTAWQVVSVNQTQRCKRLPLDQFNGALMPPIAERDKPVVKRFVFISDTHGTIERPRGPRKIENVAAPLTVDQQAQAPTGHSCEWHSMPTQGGGRHCVNMGYDVPDGDVLCHCGDFSSTGSLQEVAAFCKWFGAFPHKRKIVIAGNHDLTLHGGSYGQTGPRFGHSEACHPQEAMRICAEARRLINSIPNCEYLCDSGTSVDGITIWGSPWSPEFCDWAFNLPRGEPIREKWRLIPTGVDVLLTHGPPLGHGDTTHNRVRAGCLDLLAEVQQRVRPQVHAFGHIHEAYGATSDGVTTYLNAATCTIRYRPEHPPLVMDVRPRAKGGEGGEAQAAIASHQAAAAAAAAPACESQKSLGGGGEEVYAGFTTPAMMSTDPFIGFEEGTASLGRYGRDHGISSSNPASLEFDDDAEMDGVADCSAASERANVAAFMLGRSRFFASQDSEEDSDDAEEEKALAEAAAARKERRKAEKGVMMREEP